MYKGQKGCETILRGERIILNISNYLLSIGVFYIAVASACHVEQKSH